MNIVQIEENIKQIINKIIQNELNQQDFIYELLLAYGHRSQSVWRVRSGERNLAEDKENSVFWKRQLYFKIARQQDLHVLIDEMRKEKRTETNKIRFLIVTDFKTILAIDTKTNDPLDVPFADLAKKFDFFLPWAGMEKAVYQGENPADVEIIAEYQVFNINPQKFEYYLHAFFGESCLDLLVADKDGKNHQPKEWFIAPLNVIQQAVELLVNGQILNYQYNKYTKYIELK
ncbi:GIY-YIG nuclease family protein [Acinetobacter baumannii]|nr:GIY-YIG nuclease family protein [Acinetobacter baumannii]